MLNNIERRLPLFLASSLAILALSGCGGDGSSTDSSITLPDSSTPTPSPTPTPTPTPTSVTTADVDCPYSGSYMGDYSDAGMLTATWSWACDGTNRSLTGNGLPDHAVGTFPDAGNPNTISIQTVSGSMTLTPTMGTTNTQIGGPGGASVYARNSVKFDPGTAGTCPSSMTSPSDCNLANGTDQWRVEALGQDTFDFGEDSNNAHVQPTGEYHYHGMPEGILSNAGASDSNKKMVLIGWAGDGYPVYGRYCYSSAMDATSELKVCTGSYIKDTVADSGRPSTSLVPLGAFLSDWTYSEGSGDLDDCNGRTGVTPEFPDGIYYYMATDSYPYMSRCLKGNIS